ncbi:MAG: hypothetical protein L3J39_05420 [Verrucomicrobiales bacterium]|nr:hypothetical protein [Verrucomicrobiales bacterium]
MNRRGGGMGFCGLSHLRLFKGRPGDSDVCSKLNWVASLPGVVMVSWVTAWLN